MWGRTKEKGGGGTSSPVCLQEEEIVACNRVLKWNAEKFSATEECLGNLGSIQSSTGDFTPLSKQEEPLDLLVMQFLVYRIGKIDGIVRLDALQISQMVKGALERFLYQYYHS